jgi:hypothetical protein
MAQHRETDQQHQADQPRIAEPACEPPAKSSELPHAVSISRGHGSITQILPKDGLRRYFQVAVKFPQNRDFSGNFQKNLAAETRMAGIKGRAAAISAK